MNSLETLFRIVADVSWRASWLILAVLLVRAALRNRLSARFVFVAWIAVACRLLLPLSWATPWSPFRANPWTAIPLSTPNGASTVELTAEPPALTGGPSGAATTAVSGSHTFAFPAWSAVTWAALIWACGVGVLSIARASAHVRFSRQIRRSPPTPDSDLRRVSAALARSEFIPAGVIVTDAVPAPALHGLFKPRLLFPTAFIDALTSTELQHLVAHEAAHHGRRDLIIQALIRITVVVHWFNPLAWILLRLSRVDCELACDETVLRNRHAQDRAEYGAALLKIVRLTNGHPLPPLALGVAESKHHLKRRIQMILAARSSSLARTLAAAALFLAVVALSLTRETRAQDASAPLPPAKRLPLVAPTDGPLPPNHAAIEYGPSTDGLDALFPNGVVATIGDRSVTVADVRRELQPLVYQLKLKSKDQADFDHRISRLQNSVVSALVSRVLLIKKFYQRKNDEPERHIAAETVDKAIDDELRERFGGDRSKFLAYMREQGMTLASYRQSKEEDIIYGYMRGQERNLDKDKVRRVENAPNQFHLRLIQLKRADGETDATLLAKANGILQRFRAGESFADLAKEYSDDLKRDKGGDWGWQSPSNLKPDFQAKVAPLKIGEVTEPILIPEGCFLLYIEARR